jgi:hypothetical protein
VQGWTDDDPTEEADADTRAAVRSNDAEAFESSGKCRTPLLATYLKGGGAVVSGRRPSFFENSTGVPN